MKSFVQVTISLSQASLKYIHFMSLKTAKLVSVDLPFHFFLQHE